MSAMGYEWHWRLDDDSRLSEPVGYDVFQLMATNNMLYSYLDIVQVIDPARTTNIARIRALLAPSLLHISLNCTSKSCIQFHHCKLPDICKIYVAPSRSSQPVLLTVVLGAGGEEVLHQLVGPRRAPSVGHAQGANFL